MHKLTFILFILIFSNSFGQEKSLLEITKIETITEDLWIIDTLKTEKWNALDERRKSKIRNYMVEENTRIKNDTSRITQILYYGLPEKIKIVGTDFDKTIETKNESKKYSYRKMICYPVREKTYELIAFDRNTGIKEFTVYFLDSKRFANLNFDTKFSEVYINPNFDIELEEFEEGAFFDGLDENGIPLLAKTKIIKMEDEIIVDHRHARK